MTIKEAFVTFIIARQRGGHGQCVAIFNGQLGDTPTFHGVQPYQFDDDSWSRMSYYPSRCLGEAALKGEFENQVYSPESEKVVENPPAAKKAKLTPEEIENKRIGELLYVTTDIC